MKDQVVLITGGARGIGAGIAGACLDAGAKVMIADLAGSDRQWQYALASADELQATLAKYAAQEGRLQATPLDVTDRASCQAAVDATLEAFGTIDVLVNNAGVVQSGGLAHFSEADWDQVFDVNTKGVFLMTQAAYPALQASASTAGHAAVINTASIAGKKGYPNMAAYCGSKFAVIGITQSLATELAPENITVNAICPGMVGTAMWLEHLLPSNASDIQHKEEEFTAQMQQTIPLGRAQTVEDMGDAVVFLAGAVNITGVALSVAGGFEMN